MRKNASKIQKPSEEFFKFLKVVNAVRESFLPGYGQLMQLFTKGESGEIVFRAREATEKVLLERIKTLPELCEYLLDNRPQEKHIDQLISQYDDFLNKLHTLVQVVKACSTKSVDFEGEIFVCVTQEYLTVIVNENGTLIYKPWVSDIFKDVDARRFKNCPVCGDIYWLPRLNKQACSKCSNTYRQRTLLSNPKKRKEINEKRREIYKTKRKELLNNGTI